jgi:hypothetical protein
MEWSAPDGSTHEATFDDAPFRSDRTPSDQDFSGGARRNRTSDLSIIRAKWGIFSGCVRTWVDA